MLRTRTLSLAVCCVLACGALSLTGCKPAPVLTKAELDEKKLSEKHPKLSDEQKDDCRSCHKEAPAIRK